MKKVLVVNCFKRGDYAADFDCAIRRRLGDVAGKILRMTELQTSELNTSTFSHLILSGSETSALDDYPWTAPLMSLVTVWVKTGKPTLGICYGHQFLARVLAGRHCVCRAETPEFGWVNIKPDPCALFKGISGLTAMVSHYDEVINLPRDFTVSAKTAGCGVHAFQYRDLPVWGIQFHPEYGVREAQFIFQQVRKSDPASERWFIGVSPGPEDLDNCRKVFQNFLSMGE